MLKCLQHWCLACVCVCVCVCVNVLRYWTDNGACYYYNTSSQYNNYEDLLKAVKKDADDSGLPLRYMQVRNVR